MAGDQTWDLLDMEQMLYHYATGAGALFNISGVIVLGCITALLHQCVETSKLHKIGIVCSGTDLFGMTNMTNCNKQKRYSIFYLFYVFFL